MPPGVMERTNNLEAVGLEAFPDWLCTCSLYDFRRNT